MLEGGVFKRLPNNDTGQAQGNQAGILIPRAISKFFPQITGTPTSHHPTPGVRVEVDMYIDGSWIGKANSSYHLESWGGKRRGEFRLTDQLSPLRNQAKEGDIAVFVIDPEDERKICLHLFRKKSKHFAVVDALTGDQSWGVLDTGIPPIPTEEVATARQEIKEKSTESFELFTDQRAVFKSIVSRKVRARAFRLEVLAAYDFRCAISGSTMVTISGCHGLDAAHIVPVEKNGVDHIANGLALSKDLHWAFDNGLLAVDPSRRVRVSSRAMDLPENQQVRALNGRVIREPTIAAYRPNPEALKWHWDNVFVR